MDKPLYVLCVGIDASTAVNYGVRKDHVAGVYESQQELEKALVELNPYLYYYFTTNSKTANFEIYPVSNKRDNKRKVNSYGTRIRDNY